MTRMKAHLLRRLEAMTMTDPAIPPLRDLPSGRLDVRKQHLLVELTGESHHVRPSLVIPRTRLVAFAAGLAAVAMIAAIALLATRAGTETASAAEVLTKISQAMSTPVSLRGEYTVRTRPAGPAPRRRHGCLNCKPVVPTPSKFVIGTDGSYALSTLPLDASIKSDSAYNASTGVQILEYGGGVKGLHVYVKADNLDPAQATRTPEAQLAAWVQHALAARSPRVKNTSFEGRPAWALTLRFTPGDDFFDTYGTRVDVTVDKETGLVLQVVQYANSPDRWTSIESVHNLQVGTPTSAADFTFPKPAGYRSVTHSFGFRRVAVSEAAAIVGYQPLLPTKTGGRALAEFAVAKTSSQKLLPELVGTPVYRDVASARYGRGLDSFTITMRHGSPPSDVVPGGTSARTVTLSGGALAGETAWLSTSPPDPGYLAVFHAGLVVQIHAFSTEDALMVANSLTQAK
jgi:hypothetical protein